MEEHLEGSWEQFEAWIRNTIGGGFTWKIRPLDSAENREMVANLIEDAIKRNNGTFPEKNSFIERMSE